MLAPSYAVLYMLALSYVVLYVSTFVCWPYPLDVKWETEIAQQTNLGFHKADYLTQSLFGWYVEIKGVKGNNEK
jgi:hypothetical protein